MSPRLFEERPIAVIWDFDDTLIPGAMQAPIFKRYGVEPRQFWDEADALPEFYRQQGIGLVSEDTLYLNHMLSYVRAGRFPGLSNPVLKELGQELEFYPGQPEFLAQARAVVDDQLYSELQITVEHYIVSTGLRQMILGSAIEPYVDGIWGCEFAERAAPPGFLDHEPEPTEPSEITDLVYTIDNTTKTRAIFEINKGVNKDDRIEVNSSIAPEDRRIPFENMIYIADGPSDVPVFSILKRFGGKTLAVYDPASERKFDRVHGLLEQGRVDAVHEADYRPDGGAARWIRRAIGNTARDMLKTRRAERDTDLIERVGQPPRHLSSEAPDGN